ncbi:MAG: hypothetical protein ACQUHE_11120 [Bacteroidia bacterium]
MNQSGIERIRQVWSQNLIPVLYRRGTGYPLLMRLPYQEGNRAWLKGYGRNNPQWIKDKQHWELPQAWFNDLVSKTLSKWGKLYIIQPYREQETCAPACWNALGHECQCSCMGANHGSQSHGGNWFIVSDTFATRWNAKELACRLLVKK